jgi:hypothetical protein
MGWVSNLTARAITPGILGSSCVSSASKNRKAASVPTFRGRAGGLLMRGLHL